MEAAGGVGIVCHAAGRGNKTVHVKALVEGGAAEKSGTVQIGHQIIAIDNKDVTSCTLDEVASLLRGPVNSTVSLRLLEMREVHMEMERTEETDDYGHASISVEWKEGVSEQIVERVWGAGHAVPRKGDRLLKIDGVSLADLPDGDIKQRLIGPVGSTVQLDFARGVAHHSVVLARQALGGTHETAPQPPPIPGPTQPSSSNSSIVNLQASYGSSANSEGITPQGMSPETSPGPETKPIGKPILSISPAPSVPRAPARANVQSSRTAPSSAAESLDAIGDVREDDTVKKQLVDIARKLKDELETQAHEIVALKAKHKSEIVSLEEKMQQQQQQIHSQQQQLQHQQQQLQQRPSEAGTAEVLELLVRTQAELKQRDAELASVKSVLTRRAEAVLQGDSIKKLDELTTRCESLVEERDALVLRLQQANARSQELTVVRDLDEKSLRAAADATLRWQMQEMETQIGELRKELQVRSTREQDANDTIKIQAQALMKEKQQHEHTASMLDLSKAEVARVKDEASTQNGAVAEAVRQRDEVITKLESVKQQLSQALVACESERKAREDVEVSVEKQRAAFEEAQALWAAEAMSMQEKIKACMAEVEQARGDAKRHEQEAETIAESLSQSEQIREELRADVEAAIMRAEQAEERAEKLTDATHQWREQLEHSQRTIDAQAQAYAEERGCSEDAARRADMFQMKLQQREREVETLTSQVKELHQIRVANEQLTSKLRSYETMQQQIIAETQRRATFPIRNRQLLQMLDESAASLGSLQSLLAARDQQINFMQQKIAEIAKMREITQDTEHHLMVLKENLDWKTIAVQQMSQLVDKCKGLMRGAGVAEEEISAISAAASVSCAQAHMMDDMMGAVTHRSTTSATSGSLSAAPTAPAQVPPQLHQSTHGREGGAMHMGHQNQLIPPMVREEHQVAHDQLQRSGMHTVRQIEASM